jgi:ribosomal protein S18 acetylase RimI-like enzyme
VARWFYPNPREYVAHLPRLAVAIGGKAFAHGSAHYAEGFSGATLWLPPEVSPDEELTVATIRETVSQHLQADVFAILEQMGAAHPKEPHWYLWMIGTDPMRQSRGHGSALMRHGIASCDREKRLAYLESSNPQNLSLYVGHGFELIGTIQVGGCPPIFPMLRKPR